MKSKNQSVISHVFVMLLGLVASLSLFAGQGIAQETYGYPGTNGIPRGAPCFDIQQKIWILLKDIESNAANLIDLKTGTHQGACRKSLI